MNPPVETKNSCKFQSECKRRGWIMTYLISGGKRRRAVLALVLGAIVLLVLFFVFGYFWSSSSEPARGVFVLCDAA